jgi:choline dehydrogenase-like flavoprotein
MMANYHAGRSHEGDLEIDADVVIVGSGAGGAVVATELAEAGLSVIVLEEGPFVDGKEHGAMRPSESLRNVWRTSGLGVAIGLGGSPSINVMMGRCVGGSSVLTGGVCFRIPERVLAEWREQRGLRAYTSEALEPCYEAVERAMHVEEVPESLQSRGTKLFGEGARAMGFDLRPMRRNTSGCDGRGRCNFGCPNGAKLGVDKSYLPRAAASGAMIWSDCLVDRVVMNGDRAVGVSGRLLDGSRRPHGRLRVHARRVVVAAGSAHTPLVLARSLARRPRHLGRHMTLHPAFRMMARFDETIDGARGALQSAYSDRFEDEKITLTSMFVPPGVLSAMLPGVGPTLTRGMRNLRNLAMFGGVIHDEGGGRVMRGLGREPILTYRMALGDRVAAARMIRIMGDAFVAAGARELFPPILGLERGLSPDAFRRMPLEEIPARRLECSSQHLLGTCRMSARPEDGVVDEVGRVWGTRDLYVVDGSIVPTSLGVNPQIAIMTLATRIARTMAA